MRILYNSKDLSYKTPFGTLLPGERCDINIDIPASCQTKAVCLCLTRENGKSYASFSMEKSAERDGYEIFSVSFALPSPGLFFYYFLIETQNETFRLYRFGFDQTNMEEGKLWQLSCVPKNFSVPSVYGGSVMYQIFPDRFYHSRLMCVKEKMKPFYIHENTKDVPEYRPNEKGVVENCDFFGGNLAGIEEKLDYLHDLGVSLIYLNPIFKAWSNHRYDTADYKKIDELLGTEKDFSSLCEAAHRRGIRIVLDGVFSHTGSRSIYFDEMNEFGCGAVQDVNSPYFSWFDFQSYPDTYTSWWGIKTLPCVNEMHPDYLEYIIDGEDSVVAHWLRAGADGFRLDVADELPDAFILRLRNRIKEIKPDSLLIGEVWEDASNKTSYGVRRQYFTAGELDSVMNYPFRTAILDFVCGKDCGTRFRDTVMDLVENYPPQVTNALMNMLSTHDTPRILSALSSGDIPSSKEERAHFKMSDSERTIATARLFCATVLQFLLPGMPCIFYGDEIGVEGLEDPFCRSYFPWEKVKDSFIYEFYKKIMKLRLESPALKCGSLSIFPIKDGALEIVRESENERIRAVVNVANEAEVTVKGEILLSENANENDGCIIVSQYGFFVERSTDCLGGKA